MGIGPVPAIEALLKATNKTLGDIDLVDVSIGLTFSYSSACYSSTPYKNAEGMSSNNYRTIPGHGVPSDMTSCPRKLKPNVILYSQL